MIEARNGYLACQALQEVAQEINTSFGFKGREEKKGLLTTTVVFGTSEYPAGTRIWVKKAERLPYDEYQLNGQIVVMVRLVDVLLAEGGANGCTSPYHKNFLNCPNCVS